MSCDKPDPDSKCTTVSTCANCGTCSGETPEVVLPKCQDVSIPAGTYTNATVVVNAEGCIVSVSSGEPELYTPDECCGDSVGAPAPSGRGGKGDPGDAAVIDVQTAIASTGSAWTVENVGTTSAAIFKFTAPAPAELTPFTEGETSNLNGFVFEDGLVKAIPAGLITAVTATAQGTHSTLFSFDAAPVAGGVAGNRQITLNLDLLRGDLVALINEQATRIDTLLDTVADLNNTVEELRTDFDAYVAANP